MSLAPSRSLDHVRARLEAELVTLRERLRDAEETLGAIRDGEVDAVVVHGPGGQRVYTLENADRPYRVLVEQMREGAVTLNAEGTILYCNECLAQMLGAERQQLMGGDLLGYLRDGERDNFARMLAVGARTGVAAEYTLHAVSGREVPVNISIIELKADDGMARMMCAVVTDLTHSRQRGHELAAANRSLATEILERRRVEDSLQVALDAAGMGSWDLDLQSGLVHRSLRHDQIFGHPHLLDRWDLPTALAHFVSDDRDVVEQAFTMARGAGSIDFEARIRRAGDQQLRWLQFKGQTYYARGLPVRIAGVVMDITERRALDEQVRQAQRMEAIGQLTGGIAHDFNNLLMVISGGLEVIGRQRDPSRRERILTGMRQAVERGSALSRQLLAFSRQQALKAEPVHLGQRISGMRELLNRSLRGDVLVRTDFSDDLWPAEVDPGEFELVILNLAVNARDAMPDGGTIVIRGENAPGLSLGDLHGDFIRLSVIDTGTGMTADVLSHAFEPFFTTKEIGKGSGLGLAQTHGFARSSGGTVLIDSIPGQGTTVSLLLPRTLKMPAVVARPPSGDPVQRAGAAGHVLLVEDDDEVAALTIEMIEELGYRTTRVASAAAALGALANGRLIDIVFSDFMMAGQMNGVDLAREIRTRRPDLPVLLTSGFAEAARRSAQELGIGLLSKPYGLDELARAFGETCRSNLPAAVAERAGAAERAAAAEQRPPAGGH